MHCINLVNVYTLTHVPSTCNPGTRRFINTGPHWALFGPEEALAFNFIGGNGTLREGQGIIDEGECQSCHARSLARCLGIVTSFHPLSGMQSLLHLLRSAHRLVVVPSRLALIPRDDDLPLEQSHWARYLPGFRGQLPHHHHQPPVS